MYIHFSVNYRNSTDINSSTLIRDSVPLGTTHPVTQHHMPEAFIGSSAKNSMTVLSVYFILSRSNINYSENL